MKFATPVAIFFGLTLIAAAIFASSWMNKDVGRFQATSDKNLFLDTKTGCVFDLVPADVNKGQLGPSGASMYQPYGSWSYCSGVRYNHTGRGTFSYLFN